MRLDEVEEVGAADEYVLRERLYREHGVPRRVRDDVEGRVLVFAHRDEQAAKLYATADRVVYGHPASVELRESVGWVTVVDLRPRLAELDRERFGVDPRRSS